MSQCEGKIRNLFAVKKYYDNVLSGKEKMQAGYVTFAKALYQKEFSSQQELTDFVGCNKAHTSRTILKMQNCGYVKISNDASEKSITLTKEGRVFAENALKKESEIFSKLSEDIEIEDLKTFIKVLDQLIDKAEKLTISARRK